MDKRSGRPLRLVRNVRSKYAMCLSKTLGGNSLSTPGSGAVDGVDKHNANSWSLDLVNTLSTIHCPIVMMGTVLCTASKSTGNACWQLLLVLVESRLRIVLRGVVGVVGGAAWNAGPLIQGALEIRRILLVLFDGWWFYMFSFYTIVLTSTRLPCSYNIQAHYKGIHIFHVTET